MSKIPKVLLLVESSRGSGRALLQGIAQYAQVQGPWSICWEPGGLGKAWPKLKAREFDGIILRDVDKLKEVLDFDLPAVVIGHGRAEVACLLNVVTDSEKIGKMAAEHLLACGYRNFAFFGCRASSMENVPWSELRRRAFADRIREAGYSCQDFQLPRSLVCSSWLRECSFAARWLQSLPKPLGLMAANDERARQCAEACKVAGISVPSEVGIVGVDNDDVICGLSNPQLSSVAVDFDRGGFEAASALDCLMNGKRPGPTRIVVHPTHVVVRNSTEVNSNAPTLVYERAVNA